jgi:uncharacterized membrane protein YqhA
MLKKIETVFESILWSSRLIVIFAVIASLLTSIVMFYIASVDAVIVFKHVLHYGAEGLSAVERAELRNELITHVVEIIDGFLLATVLLIFALGLYELFISKIDQAKESEAQSNVLVINNLDDLKNRLAKVILMILIVKFFEHALQMKFETAVNLLAFAGGIALIGLSLYLSHAGEKQKH